ncbi:MAG TPA: AraC family transcriptional regulator [Clostridia bacterium]|nr:AraC family transcriptional regulator [Clostridia bacterium]
MLTQRGIRIDEVSYAVGFTDPRYFSRVFAKTVGMTPLEYREEASR